MIDREAPVAGRALRIASVPAGHPYVRRLAAPAPAPDPVVWLPDPPNGTAAWWPPAVLAPGWVTAHADTVDVVHLHFGFDAHSPDELRGWLDELAAARCPLVFTVHDLRNPHHADRARHDAALDVLVPGADGVLTLTAGAAAEIAARWGRHAQVIAHPPLVDPDRAARATPARPARSGFVVGLTAKPRAGHDPVAVLAALTAALDAELIDLDDVTVRVEVRDDTAGRALLDRLAGVAVHPRVALHVGPAPDDDTFVDRLAALDLAVLPYRFGTHSGWAQTCWEVGTAVLAPDSGCWADQVPCLTYRWPDAEAGGAPDRASLAAGVRAAHAAGPAARPDPTGMARRRREVAAAHAAVYRRVVLGGDGGGDADARGAR